MRSDPGSELARLAVAPRLARALLACALVACGGKGGAPAAKGRPPPQVTVERAATRDVPVEVRAPVDLRPIAQADVGAKTLGYLDAVLVDRGDVVKKGQLLAVVRPSDLPDQMASARGSLAQARAAVALQRSNAERAKVLVPQGLMSQADANTIAAALDSAIAQEESARGSIGALSTRLGELSLVAPFDGVVWQRRADPGALVGPLGGGAVVTLVQVDALRVFVAVNERQAVQVTVGKDARVEVDAYPGRSFAGRVVRLSPAFDPVTRTLDAEVRLDNTNGELRPGMYGRGWITLDVHKGSVVVPAGAVQISDRKAYVFVIERDAKDGGAEKAKRRPVELGVDLGTTLEITSGVKAGDEVVTAGADGLADGAAVRVARGVDPFTGKPAGSTSASATSSAAPSEKR
jgi:RND family efflux transporter MFP subunit